MSPLSPKMPPSRVETVVNATPITAVPLDTLPSAVAELDRPEVRTWTSRQVAAWMHRSGFEDAIIQRFQQHDITGAVLLDMQFEDLKELDIHSFGKRHRLWNEIHALRDSVEGEAISPAYTPFEDISRPCTAAVRSKSRNRRGGEHDGDDACTPITPGGGRRRKGRRARRNDDEIVTPAESVSIVAIEQLLPKPHRCARGERCAKWRRQQRQMAALHDEHGFPVSPEKGGKIFVAGNPGNADKAKNVVENVHLRPTSENVPSVVASSDVLGPGPLPTLEALRDVESRDPQENVKQFLTLQGLNIPPPVESPPTPPLEMFPPLQSQAQAQSQSHSVPPPANAGGPHAGLKSLPRLSIPRASSAGPALPRSAVASASATFSPCRTATDSPATGFGSGGEVPANYFHHAFGAPDRFGTPASEMDVPVTAVDLGPISRNESQSVPPNMQYSNMTNVPATHGRNASRRPSFAMPALAEDKVFSPQTSQLPSNALSRANTQRSTRSNMGNGGTNAAAAAVSTAQNVFRRASNRKSSSSSTSGSSSLMSHKQQQQADGEQTSSQEYCYQNTQHAGWMRKRKTRLLRHEWTPAHFRLTGTQLAMHRDEHPSSTALSTIDVDDYAVACSAIASGKLAAKLKALKITGSGGPLGNTFSNHSNNSNSQIGPDGRKSSKSGSDDHAKDDGKIDPAAFSFQLVPTGHSHGHGSHNNVVDSSTSIMSARRPSTSTSSLGHGADGASRESLDAASSSGSGAIATATKSHSGGNKTHHFAVKSRDDRIEWMRELMLAKALKAKGEGYEVKVNGSAV